MPHASGGRRRRRAARPGCARERAGRLPPPRGRPPPAPASAPRPAPSAPAASPPSSCTRDSVTRARSARARRSRDRAAAGVRDGPRGGGLTDRGARFRPGPASSTRSRPQGRVAAARRRQREPGRHFDEGRAHPPLPAPGRRQGLRQGSQLRGPAEAGAHRDVRHQRRGARRRRRRHAAAVGRPAGARSRPARRAARRAPGPAVACTRPSRVGDAAGGLPASPVRLGGRIGGGAGGTTVRSGKLPFPADLPPLPPPPSPDDEEEFDPTMRTCRSRWRRPERHGPGPARARRPGHRRVRGLIPPGKSRAAASGENRVGFLLWDLAALTCSRFSLRRSRR